MTFAHYNKLQILLIAVAILSACSVEFHSILHFLLFLKNDEIAIFKVEYIKIPILNFSDYFTTMTLSYWQHNIKKLEWVYFLNERKIISRMPTVYTILKP